MSDLPTLPAGHAYVIPKFDEVHANNELRKQTAKGGDWHWVRFPVRFDSLRMRRMLQTTEGTAHFGVYCLLAQIAANGRPTRGLIANRDGALTLDDISLITSLPRPQLNRAVSALLDCGWLDIALIETGAQAPTTAAPVAAEQAPHGAQAQPQQSAPADHSAQAQTPNAPHTPPVDRESHSHPNGVPNTTPPTHMVLVGGCNSQGGAGGKNPPASTTPGGAVRPDLSDIVPPSRTERDAVARMLERIGVPARHQRDILAADPLPSPLRVALTYAAAAKEAASSKANRPKDAKTVMRHRLTQPHDPREKVTPMHLVAAVRSGVVLRVGSTLIADPKKCKGNAAGVNYDGATVATAEDLQHQRTEVA